MTLNRRLSSVPDPTREVDENAETIKCPGLAGFDDTDIPPLKVPALSNPLESGVTTVGSNET